ncbi:hypothetical protein [Luteolibacter luteus]|nr:hypothetical protein [Luteolibacter luteus]
MDLNICNVGASNADEQHFSTPTTVFTGSSIVDLSSFTNLPAAKRLGTWP